MFRTDMCTYHKCLCPLPIWMVGGVCEGRGTSRSVGVRWGWVLLDGWKACTGVWVMHGEGSPRYEVAGTSQGSCWGWGPVHGWTWPRWWSWSGCWPLCVLYWIVLDPLGVLWWYCECIWGRVFWNVFDSFTQWSTWFTYVGTGAIYLGALVVINDASLIVLGVLVLSIS